jgi:hypothetical protein
MAIYLSFHLVFNVGGGGWNPAQQQQNKLWLLYFFLFHSFIPIMTSTFCLLAQKVETEAQKPFSVFYLE